MNLHDIRTLIGQGDTASAIKALVNRVQEGAGRNKRLRDDLLILSNRFEELKRKETIGLLDMDDVVREYAQVNEALLNLIAEMESGRAVRESPAQVPEKMSPHMRRVLFAAGILLCLLIVGYIIWKSIGPASPEPESGIQESTVPPNPTGLPCGKNFRPNIDTVFIEGGLYTMGSSYGEADEKPHDVTVNSFYIDRHEVTNAEYAAFLNAVGKHDQGWIDFEKSYHEERCRVIQVNNSYAVEPGYEKYPVVCISWTGAMAFACYYGMRLPTEAEWEYAARGGRKGMTNRYAYAGSDKLDAVGWYNLNAGHRTHPVAQKLSNEAGLYDMSGNLYEWCSDYYDAKYYFYSPRINPKGPDSSGVRVVRGGNVFLPDSTCRSANRGLWSWADKNVGIGFRCVQDP